MTIEQEPKKKKFVDPATVVYVGNFAFKSIAQAVVGWVGLEGVKAGWEKSKNWFRSKNGKPDSEGISQKEPPKET